MYYLVPVVSSTVNGQTVNGPKYVTDSFNAVPFWYRWLDRSRHRPSVAARTRSVSVPSRSDATAPRCRHHRAANISTVLQCHSLHMGNDRHAVERRAGAVMPDCPSLPSGLFCRWRHITISQWHHARLPRHPSASIARHWKDCRWRYRGGNTQRTRNSDGRDSGTIRLNQRIRHRCDFRCLG